MSTGRTPYDIVQAPVLTEKSVKLAKFNCYTFRVHKDATKTDIKRAIEQMFENINVKNVNIMKVRGKNKTMRFSRFPPGRTPSWKKAIVKVAEGQTLPVYGELQ